MKSCVHVDDVEDLALGILVGERAKAARNHLALCATCRAASRQLDAECMLFETRALAFESPLPAFCPAPSPAVASSAESSWFGPATRGLVAALACAASLAGVGKIHRSLTLDVPSASTLQAQADMTIATWEEPIACVFPASGVVRTSNEELACVTSSSHAICEAEVTSCAATP